MKTTLTAKAARKPVSGGSGTPNTQLAEIGAKIANSHGHHGMRPPAGAISGGKIRKARRMSGSITREAAQNTIAQACVCHTGPPKKNVQCKPYAIASRKKLRAMRVRRRRSSTSAAVPTSVQVSGSMRQG
jgi:hypothetical protein